MRIAAVQMASGSNVAGNLLEAEKLIGQAAQQGAKMVVLPENFGIIGMQERDVLDHREEPGTGPLQDFLANQSRQHGIYLAGGTIPIKVDAVEQRYRNSTLVYDPQGCCVTRYDKIHLFDVSLPDQETSYQESSVCVPGEEAVVFRAGDVLIGLAICYDLRFPELFRLLVDKGASIILLPSAFTQQTGMAHWHTLLKARAIENQCFLVASAQGGYHVNGRETYGHSSIVDPWGNILDEIETGSGFAIADLNLAHQQQIRERFPVLTHRRFFVRV